MTNHQHPIRTARIAAGLSQQAVADQIRVTKQTVSGWERGLFEVSPENARTLVQILPALTLEQIYTPATREAA